jgi:thioredoxin-related protein
MIQRTMTFRLLLATLLLPAFVHAQSPGNSGVKWVTMEQAQELVKKDPKPIFIDVYTNWCGPCKMLDRNTFSDPQVAAYINRHFHAVKFNAESGDPVTFNGQRYENPDYDPGRAQGRNGTHRLTYAIANVNGRIAYPTIVYMDSELNVLTPVQGYMTPEQMEPILAFFGEGHYKDKEYQAFINGFKSRR